MYDVVIAGAGIVGLSTAYQLVQKSPDLKILIIEKESAVAKHQTGNNSGVIHSGIYYKPGSLKAKNCISGYHMLLDFVREYDIPHELCGKIIVATDASELPALQNIYDRGIANGLDGLEWLEKEAMNEIEPYLNGIKGIRVPQTGIIDYKAMCIQLEKLLKKSGVEFCFEQRVKDVKRLNGNISIIAEQSSFQSKLFINCAGLYSDKLARMSNDSVNVKIVPFRGEIL